MFRCYLDGTAASCRRQAVGDRRPPCSCLFTAFQAASKTILERFCIVSNGRHVGLRAWAALVDSLHSPKQMFRSCRQRWNCEKMAGDGTHDSAIRRRRRCLCRIDVTCDKFDNRWYVLKPATGLEQVNRLTGYRFNKRSGYTLPLTVMCKELEQLKCANKVTRSPPFVYGSMSKLMYSRKEDRR